METIQKCNEYEDWEPKGAYWFNRLVKKLRSAQEDYNDTRTKLVTKYADEPDEDGNVKVAEVHIPAFSTAMGELLEEEFEIEGIKPIKFPTGLKLSPIEMGLMEEVVDMSAFLDDDEDE
ncbi:uncharacterized protein METZ01_LOCUS427722 [marine metagenome]|uniref:Uncharacterized protein n=1 Tax=marine metagenome TaxID=408172 RepID=A0A382XX55_9ZZZZ